MLPRQYRLKKNSGFKATYRAQHSLCSGGIVLFAGFLKKDDYPTKAGFVVSKKVHKRAVRRNRLKRLMRESYRTLLKEGIPDNSQKYISLVLLGRERALGMSFAEIKNNIKLMLEKI